MARHKRRAVAEINVVPYIDVMLVLLIIFMITAPLLSQGVEIELPTADAQPISPDQQEPLVVSVDKNGGYFLNIGAKPDKPIDAQLMVNRVAAVLKLRPDTPVLVRGDRDVTYGEVVRAMVYLQQAGVAKVGLMTEGLN
jgi:biopolymer transport protein TolR